MDAPLRTIAPAQAMPEVPVVENPAWLDDSERSALRQAYHADETTCVEALLAEAGQSEEVRGRIRATAEDLVLAVRKEAGSRGGLDAFLQEYDLSSQEGIVLMSLAEALLRIPDPETAERLIRDKIVSADWEKHLGKSPSLFVNASTWALMLTGRVLDPGEMPGGGIGSVLNRLISRSGEPIIRQAVMQAMRLLGRQFVMGRTIREALDRAREPERQGYRHSYDMLGESARTAEDAARYLQAYMTAVTAIGKASAGRGPVHGPGISIKLSALDPRYHPAQRDLVRERLLPKLIEIALHARSLDIGMTIDAEEAERLELSLDLIAALLDEPALAGWDGLGLAVQAYQKRAPAVIDWIVARARGRRRRLMLRLVKGAYWDAEIKAAQVLGHEEYPVYTRKPSTDLSYIVCMQRLLTAADVVYPQFATHNAHTVATAMELAGNRRDFEFQRLHGMGEALYARVMEPHSDVACRVYAPVGTHKDLLAYLVRRLLENGANTSFVNRITDARAPIADIVADPAEMMRRVRPTPHPRIPLPRHIYGERLNSRGIDLADPLALAALKEAMRAAAGALASAAPLVGGVALEGEARPLRDPADRRRIVGHVVEAEPAAVERVLAQAARAARDWDATAAAERADCLDRAADLYEQHMPELMHLAVREAGKTLPDAVSEVREAIDFCRYYAARARNDLARPRSLPGPTGERNEISLHGRGVFACISPWNFPLAIFTGQVTAALAAGNAVVAKPAEQTPLIAARAVSLLHAAGIPPTVLHLLPGDGARVGGRLVADPRVNGVAFTGGTDTAQAINRSLAARDGPIATLIAETGGLNAMIVDSSALAEQVVGDVVVSAFGSTGQRCSALRMLFLQSDVADRIITMLAGAMAELRGGDPGLLSTDFGPVIDEPAKAALGAHLAMLDRNGRRIAAARLPPACAFGSFVAPHAYEIDRSDMLEREVFGPILHVIRYPASRIDQVIDAINRTGYGLTVGIHSRIDERVRYLTARLRVGNAYVNRSMIGAVVGVQPFGGEGLSGTGPKAGGPNYLQRFAVERVLSVDTTAAGGNASLVSLGEG